VITLILLETIELGLNLNVAIGELGALGFELSLLVAWRQSFALEIFFLLVVRVDQ